jgi:CheY-like chemotaxis protein
MINIISEKTNEDFFMEDMTILIVNDDPVSRKTLGKRLEKERYEVLY